MDSDVDNADGAADAWQLSDSDAEVVAIASPDIANGDAADVDPGALAVWQPGESDEEGTVTPPAAVFIGRAIRDRLALAAAPEDNSADPGDMQVRVAHVIPSQFICELTDPIAYAERFKTSAFEVSQATVARIVTGIRKIGAPVMQAISAACHSRLIQAVRDRSRDENSESCSVVAFRWYGPTPNCSMGICALAQQLRRTHLRLSEDINVLAAATHWTNRLMLGSSHSALLARVKSPGPPGTFKLVAAFRFRAYDSTPLPTTANTTMRQTHSPEYSTTNYIKNFYDPHTPQEVIEHAKAAAPFQEAAVDSVETSVLATSDPAGSVLLKALRADQRTTKVGKVHQLEMCVAYLVKSMSGAYRLFRCPMSCPLQFLTTETAEVLFHAHREQQKIPMASELWECAPISFDVSARDRGSANLLHGKFCQYCNPNTIHIGFACDLHCLSTAQGRSYAVFGPLVSGTICLSLALKQSGSVKEFRSTIAHVIRLSFRHRRCAPPRPGHACLKKMSALMDLFIPSDAAGASRRRVLSAFIHSDPQLNLIDVCTEEAEPNFAWMAKLLSWALLPRSIGTFPRSRWLLSLQSVQNTGLLANFANLLQRAIPLWQHFTRKGLPLPATRATMERELARLGAQGRDDRGIFGATWP